MAVSDVEALAIGLETTFATVPGASHASYARVPMEGGVKLELGNEVFRPESMATELGLRSALVLGGKKVSLGFKVPLHGLATAGSGVAANRTWMSRLLKTCGLEEANATGTSVSGGASTTSSINVADASALEEGALVLIAGELTQITAIVDASPDVLTVSPALSAAPGAGVVVYAPSIYYLSDSQPGTASFVVKKDGYSYTVSGCKGTFKLSAPAKQRPMLEFSYQGDTWARTEPTGTIEALTTAQSLVNIASPLLRGTSRTAVPCADFQFDPGLSLAERLSGAGTNGRSGYDIVKGDPKGSFKPYLTTQMQTDFLARTTGQTILQIGATAGACFGLLIPKAEIAEYPLETPIGGIDGFDLKFNAIDPGVADTSPFLLHFL